MNLHFGQVLPQLPYLLRGILVTLEFTLCSAVAGFIWGIVLALLKISKLKPVAWFGVVYTSIFRGTPLLVQLFLIYYATPELTGYDITALQAAVATFGLNSAAYISEVLRGGILAVDVGQREAAVSLGIPYRKMMFDIILPQAFKHILPALVNESVALLKDSALVSTIGVVDVMRRAQVIQNTTYLAFEPLILVAGIYYVLVMILTSIARLLERRVRRSDTA
jgi:arginine/lysine/histidine transport system permease protein